MINTVCRCRGAWLSLCNSRIAPFFVFLARVYTTTFHFRAIRWINLSKSRFVCVDSSPFLLQLDLLREPRQSDAYTCLRLVSRESEMGPHDVILWPHPYSSRYSSRMGATSLATRRIWISSLKLLICNSSRQWPHTCIFTWVIFWKE